jgi:chromosome segregation ATPase
MQDSRSSGTQLARLRQESASIDEEFGKLSATVSEKDKADQALGQAIEALGQDIRSLKAGVHPALSGEGALLAEQRDRLRKQSSAALVSLQAARQQWLDIQGVNDLGPERVEALRKGRDELEALIQAKELSKANLLKQAAEDENTLAELTSPTKANGSGIAQLEQELRSLNSHSQGLGSELQKLQQSDMDRTRKINESVEQEKQQWEAKLAEGVGQNKALRLELDKLRKEMIDLDKKKAAMEKALYGQ